MNPRGRSGSRRRSPKGRRAPAERRDPSGRRDTAKRRYLLFHKPYGVLCQFQDKSGRPCLGDYVPVPGVYPSGRLDWDSEGLLLLTDDGALIHGLSTPEAKAPKTYWVQVEGIPSDEALESLRRGVMVAGRKTRPARVERFPQGDRLPPRPVPIRFRKQIPTAWIRLTLVEGRNRQVRRMTAAVGHPTLRLIRHSIGPYTLDGLSPGQWREVAQMASFLP